MDAFNRSTASQVSSSYLFIDVLPTLLLLILSTVQVLFDVLPHDVLRGSTTIRKAVVKTRQRGIKTNRYVQYLVETLLSCCLFLFSSCSKCCLWLSRLQKSWKTGGQASPPGAFLPRLISILDLNTDNFLKYTTLSHPYLNTRTTSP